MERKQIEAVLTMHPTAVFECGGTGRWSYPNYVTNAEVRKPGADRWHRQTALRLHGNPIAERDKIGPCDWQVDYPLGQVKSVYANTLTEAVEKLTEAKQARERAEAKKKDAYKQAQLLSTHLHDLLKDIGCRSGQADPYGSYGGGVKVNLSNKDAALLIERLNGGSS